MKQYYLLKICLLLSFNCALFAQDLNQNIHTVSLEIYFNYQVEGEVNRISSTFFLPQNLPNKQRIVNIDYSVSPYKIYEIGGNQYIDFVFDRPRESFVLKMRLDIELYRYDLTTARTAFNHSVNKTLSAEKYLRNELFLRRKHKRIQEIADTISGENQLEIVRNIYDFVVNHLDYNDGIRENLGAIKALKKGHGDCTEYSDLFVTLCRAKDIPARVVAGCVTELSTNSNHHWTEVFLEDVGWVPFDPTFGDSESAVFGQMPNKYIYYSNNRTDKILFSGNGRHKWWIANRHKGDVVVSSFYNVKYPIEHQYQKAKRLYQKQNYEEANLLVEDLLERDKRNSRYHALKGLIFAQQNNYFEACKEIQYALALAKNNSLKQNAYYALSSICALRGQKHLSLSFLRQVLVMGNLDIADIQTNKNFAAFRQDEDFEGLLERYR